MMEVIFWLLLLLIVYCYFGYPIVLSILAKRRAKAINKKFCEPTVTIVMSVYNEEDVIAAKLKNLTNLDYPHEKINILIGSDGSIDKTNKIIKDFNDLRVTLCEDSQRRGKMCVLNDLLQKTKSEIVIFNDARQILDKRAVRELVANFHDPEVGCVSGELMLSSEDGATAAGVNLYWRYEKFLRNQEAKIHSMLGATGAIYAIRRELFVKIPEDIVLDDVFVPFKIIEKGYRAIFDGTAKAYDKVADNPQEEHRRKARTLSGNYQIFSLFPQMFNPLKSPIAVQLFSHKFLRLMVPFFMIFLFVINIFLLDKFFYEWMFKLQVLFYIIASIGYLLRQQKYGILSVVKKMCYVPYVFCLLNFSAFIGFFRFVSARQQVTWEKARG